MEGLKKDDPKTNANTNTNTNTNTNGALPVLGKAKVPATPLSPAFQLLLVGVMVYNGNSHIKCREYEVMAGTDSDSTKHAGDVPVFPAKRRLSNSQLSRAMTPPYLPTQVS